MEKSKIIMGTWAWGDTKSVYGKENDTKKLKEAFDEAIRNGFYTWDTSYNYGLGDRELGKSEKILGKCLKGVDRSQVQLSDKVSPYLYRVPGLRLADRLEDLPKNCISQSLKNLGTDYVDIYWLHMPEAIDVLLPQLVQLLKSGKIKSIGVSNFNLDELIMAQKILAQYGVKISAVQNHFSLINRTSETSGLLEYCKRNNIDFWGYMPLEQGALTGKYGSHNPPPANSMRNDLYGARLYELDSVNSAIGKIAQKHNVRNSAVAMAYVISKGITPVVGMTDKKYVKDAKDAINLQLSKEEIETLENAAKNLQPVVGGWEKQMVESADSRLMAELRTKKPEPSQVPQKEQGKKPEPSQVPQKEQGKKPEPSEAPQKEQGKKPEPSQTPQKEPGKTPTPSYVPKTAGEKNGEPKKSREELLKEYNMLLDLYNDALDELEEKRVAKNNNEIPYSEYENYALYVVGRYNYMKKLYDELKAMKKEDVSKGKNKENTGSKENER